MNTMSHKGYTARVEFDDRDNIFVGRILGIRSIVSFHGDTVDSLRAEFEAAVDDYVHECKAAGKSLNQWATEVLQSAVQASR